MRARFCGVRDVDSAGRFEALGEELVIASWFEGGLLDVGISKSVREVIVADN